MCRLEQLFGELRALLHAPWDRHSSPQVLRSLLEQAHTAAPEQYRRQWLPYLESAQAVRDHAMFDAGSTAELREGLAELREILPCARATLRLQRGARSMEVFAELATSPTLSSVVALNIGAGELGVEALRVLLESPYLTNVRSMMFGLCELQTSAWRTLANWAGLEGIVELRLLGVKALRLDDLALLLSSPHLIDLRKLTVNHCPYRAPFGDVCAELIASFSTLASLQTLSLSKLELQDGGAKALASSPHLRGVRGLHLHHNAIGDDGIEELMHGAQWTALGSLGLGRNVFGSGGVSAIATSRHVSQLEELDLERTTMEDEGARALARSPQLSMLSKLWLRSCDLSAEAAGMLTSSETLTSLEHLSLNKNRFGDQGVEQIAAHPIPYLRSLDLTDNQITSRGVQALARSEHLAKLQWLCLNKNPIDDQAAIALASSGALRGLTELVLWDTDIGAVGQTALRQSTELPASLDLVLPAI